MFTSQELYDISQYLQSYAKHLGPSAEHVREVEDVRRNVLALAHKAVAAATEKRRSGISDDTL